MMMIRQIGSRALAVLTIAAALLAITPAGAINWEGHEAWDIDAEMLEPFTDRVPSAPPAKRPTCDERAAAARSNPYEQIPLAGVNCIAAPAPQQ